MQTSRNAEEEKLAAVAEYVVMDGEGNLPGDLYVELREMMVVKWDDWGAESEEDEEEEEVPIFGCSG